MHIINALTIDVEDYFHANAFAEKLSINDWEQLPSRVEENTSRLLQIFNDADVLATFFVLGWVASRYPRLVREIKSNGHEIASHGLNHQLIYSLTPNRFREETVTSKKMLEDIVGTEVVGYRAASFSITARSLWAIDILIEAGFKYDSSIVPARHDFYGIPGAPAYPYHILHPHSGSMIEFPPTTIELCGLRVPIGGGGYFRIFPFQFSHWGLNSINARLNKPFSFYLHPWDMDSDQPRIDVGLKSRFRHYRNLDKTETRLRKILEDFQFSPMSEVIDKMLAKDDVPMIRQNELCS